MKIQLLIDLIKTYKQDKSLLGFTLIELLVASLLSSVVIAAAGGGLVTIISANKIAESKTQRQLELNRAIDFISEEVRMSKKVEWDNGLKLTIASDNSTVVYSTASSSSAGSIWINDFVVNRKVGTNPNAVLVDALKAPPASEVTAIQNLCPSGSATFHGSNGFYICRYNDERTVDFHLYGQILSTSTEYAKVKTKAFARAQ